MAVARACWHDCTLDLHPACGYGSTGRTGNVAVIQRMRREFYKKEARAKDVPFGNYRRRIDCTFSNAVAGPFSERDVNYGNIGKDLSSSCINLHLFPGHFVQNQLSCRRLKQSIGLRTQQEHEKNFGNTLFRPNYEGYIGTRASCRRKTTRSNEEVDADCSPWHGCELDSQDNVKFIQKENRLLKLVPRVMHVVTFGVGFLLTLWSGRALAAIGGKTVAAAASSSAKTRGLEVLTSAWTGLVAGCLHALTGPDHLAALAPLCIGRSKVESAAVGALWGVGHDAGQVLFGIAFLLLKDKLHIELIRTWGARVVGITLIAIGVVGIKEAQEVPVSCLAGNEQGQNTGQSSGSLKGVPVAKKSLGLTFATGLVYGLQPDALLMILPALALPSRFSGFAFLGMFLVGTVIAMGSYTAFIGSCSEALQERVPWITHRLTWASSLVAIAFGLGVLIGESFGINLF